MFTAWKFLHLDNQLRYSMNETFSMHMLHIKSDISMAFDYTHSYRL